MRHWAKGGLSTVFGIGCLPFYIGLDVSLFYELFVHCRLGDFLVGCTSAEVFPSDVFRLWVSFVVSTHSTDVICLLSFTEH